MKLQVHIGEADVFLTRFILRYVNSEGSAFNGKITAYQVERRGRFSTNHSRASQRHAIFFCQAVVNQHLPDSLRPLGSEQSKQIVFAPSVEPKFVNVPQNNFVEPFVLNPGTWTVLIEAEGILLVSLKPTFQFDRLSDVEMRSFPLPFVYIFLFFALQDYLVLLPSAYYEAPILQMRVTDPCSYAAGADSSQRYTLGLERFE